MPYDSNGNWYAPTGSHKAGGYPPMSVTPISPPPVFKPIGGVNPNFPPIVFPPPSQPVYSLPPYQPGIVFNSTPPPLITITCPTLVPFDFSSPLKCTCDIMALMQRGCKCGQFEREQKSKN